MYEKKRRRKLGTRVRQLLLGTWYTLLWYLQLPFWWLGYGLRSLFRSISRSAPTAVLLGILLFPIWLMHSAVRLLLRSLVYAWRSAGFWNLAYGTPCLLVLIGVGYLAVVIQLRPTHEIIRDYTYAAALAAAGENHEAARLYYERLAQLEPANRKVRYSLARALAELDEQARVEMLLAELAPRDRAVHAPAHVWRAQRILSQGQLQQAEMRHVEAQLTQALHLKPNDTYTQALLGQLYMGQGRHREAARLLKEVQPKLPVLSLTLAKAHALQGSTEDARRVGEEARQYFQQRVQRDPNDHASRLHYAEATMFLQRYLEAVQILEGGLVLREDALYREALARVYLAWADSVPTSDPQSTAKKLQLLEQSLKTNPREILVFDRVMRLLKSSNTQAEARQMLTGVLAQGHASALVHLLLGTDAGERGDQKSAIWHLQQAHDLNPDMAVAANNLAWHLAEADPPQLEQALVLIDNLASQWPQVAHFRDTRGQILAKMGKWEEAVTDLEAALPAMRDNVQLHRTLAEAYQHLGLEELAREHSRLAAQLAQSKG